MPVWANIYLGRELLRGPRPLNVLDKRRMAVENGHFSERLQSDEVRDAITAFFAKRAARA